MADAREGKGPTPTATSTSTASSVPQAAPTPVTKTASPIQASPSETAGKSSVATEPDGIASDVAARGKTTDEAAPIGSVNDAVRTDNTESAETFQQVPAAQTPENNSHVKKDEARSKEEAPILSLAQLRDYHIRKGTAPSQEEIDKVKKLEGEILAEGSKHVRGPDAENK